MYRYSNNTAHTDMTMASTSGISSILHGGPITVQPGISLDGNDTEQK